MNNTVKINACMHQSLQALDSLDEGVTLWDLDLWPRLRLSKPLNSRSEVEEEDERAESAV